MHVGGEGRSDHHNMQKARCVEAIQPDGDYKGTFRIFQVLDALLADLWACHACVFLRRC